MMLKKMMDRFNHRQGLIPVRGVSAISELDEFGLRHPACDAPNLFDRTVPINDPPTRQHGADDHGQFGLKRPQRSP